MNKILGRKFRHFCSGVFIISASFDRFYSFHLHKTSRTLHDYHLPFFKIKLHGKLMEKNPPNHHQSSVKWFVSFIFRVEQLKRMIWKRKSYFALYVREVQKTINDLAHINLILLARTHAARTNPYYVCQWTGISSIEYLLGLICMCQCMKIGQQRFRSKHTTRRWCHQSQEKPWWKIKYANIMWMANFYRCDSLMMIL